MKYIEAELAKRRGTAAPGQEEAGGTGGKLTHASLYEVPPELRAGPLGGGAAPTDDGAGAWLTGIQEVALPMAVKLKVRSASCACVHLWFGSHLPWLTRDCALFAEY